MDSKEIGNNGYQNNGTKIDSSDTKQVKDYGLLEGIKNFFRNLHFPKIFSKSILSRKAEINEDNVHQQINEDKKDFLDTNKYSEICPTEMEIGGIQMSKIKTDNGIFVLPKAMYEGSGVELKEADKRIEDGKKVYKKIKNNNFDSNGTIGFVLTYKFSKKDISKLVWFLEYKACCKNNKFMSMFASNMRIPDNDGEIYDAISSCVRSDVADTYGLAYDRSGKNQSSHFKQNDAEKIQKTQKGLDFKYGDLPFGAKTILFAHGNPSSAGDVPKGTYIKLEKEGINSGFFSLLMHGMNFIKSLFRKVPKECDFREKIKICEKLSKYGETIAAIFSNKKNENLKTEIKDFVKEAGIGVDNINVRLGRELMILTEKDIEGNG